MLAGHYIDRYLQMPGKVYTMQAKVDLTENTAELCAEQCNIHSFCKSFDYCPDQASCHLHVNHTLNVSSVNLSSAPSCTHYSSNNNFHLKTFVLTYKKQQKQIRQAF